MSEAALDPYAVLGVAPDVSDLELRRVYRGLVKRHHPDHNSGSAEAATRFAQIQSAYASIAQRRRTPPAESPPSAGHAAADPGVEERITSMEREMAVRREAEHLRAQQQARRAPASHAQAEAQRRRPTPEELGYYSTDDSFAKIIDDAAEQLGERLSKSDAKKQFSRRLSDLFGRD